MRKIFASVPLALIMCLALTLAMPPAVSANTVGMVIDPTPKTVAVGQTFTVDIKGTITESEEVNSAGAHLDFNTAYLEVLGITDGDLEPWTSEYDNTPGTIDYDAVVGVGPPVTSDFLLATVEFGAKAATPPEGTPLTFVFIPH